MLIDDAQAALDRKHVHFTSPDEPPARIYREEGVFTERYDRERCMRRLDELEEQNYRGNDETGEEEIAAETSAGEHT